MLPRPPAFETAAARFAGAKGPIPTWMIGCSMPNSSQSAVRIILSSSTSQARIAAARALPVQEATRFTRVTSSGPMLYAAERAIA